MSPPPSHTDVNTLIDWLPLPLAKIRSDAEIDTEPYTRFRLAYHLWEATLKLLATLALTEYARANLNPSGGEKALVNLDGPSIGDWVGYLHLFEDKEVAPASPLGQMRDFLFKAKKDLPNCLRLDFALERFRDAEDPNPILAGDRQIARNSVTPHHLFKKMVWLRNQEFGHKATGQRPPPFYELCGPLLLGALAEVFWGLPFLTGFRLVYVTGFRQTVDGTISVDAIDLTGAGHPRPIPCGTVTEGTRLPMKDQLYLEWECPTADDPRLARVRSEPVPGRRLARPLAVGALHSLHPLALYHRQFNEVLFWNSDIDGKTANYLCYHNTAVEPANPPAKAVQEFFAPLVLRARSAGAAGAIKSVPPALAVLLNQKADALTLLEKPLADAVQASGLSPAVIHDAYHAVAPVARDRIKAAATASETVLLCCRDLVDAPMLNGLSPLLSFARKLMEYLPAAQIGPLAEVIRKTSELLEEVDPPPIAAPATKPPPAALASQPAYLMITIQSSRADPDQFVVEAWLQAPKATKLLGGGGQRCTRSDLEAEIDRLYQLALEEPVDPFDLWVEVFLPRSLARETVDRWQVTVGPLGEKVVGAEHPVMIRATERYYGPPKWRPALPALLARWPGLTAGTTLRVIQVPASPNCEALHHHVKGDRAILGAVLGEPPAAVPLSGDILTTLLYHGVPVVAWIRESSMTVEELTKLLQESALAELPARVRALRVEAAIQAKQEHPGNHIALFWDDPTRVPADVKHPALAPPEVVNG